MHQARLETIQEIEDLNHEKDIKKHDEAEVKKIRKLNKLRPSAMVKPYKMRIVPKENVLEDSTAEMGMVDLEAGSSVTSSRTDLSVYTVNPVSECSYVQIMHS